MSVNKALCTSDLIHILFERIARVLRMRRGPVPHWSQGRQRIYMDPSPNRSGGRNELREEGVARSTSAPHRDAPPGAEPPHNWLALPPDQVSLLLPRDQVLLTLLAPPPLLLLAPLAARCARILCTSASLGASAKMVVLFRMQLFRLPCA